MIEASQWIKILCLSALVATLVGVLFLFSDQSSTTSYAANYAPELAAASVGVFVALSAEQYLIALAKERRIAELRKVVGQKIIRMRDAVNAHDGKYLETAAWTSLVNSGDASLFPVELQERLFELYAKARVINSLSERVRDVDRAREMNRESHRKDRRFQELRDERTKLEEELSGKISDILKENVL